MLASDALNEVALRRALGAVAADMVAVRRKVEALVLHPATLEPMSQYEGVSGFIEQLSARIKELDAMSTKATLVDADVPAWARQAVDQYIRMIAGAVSEAAHAEIERWASRRHS